MSESASDKQQAENAHHQEAIIVLTLIRLEVAILIKFTRPNFTRHFTRFQCQTSPSIIVHFWGLFLMVCEWRRSFATASVVRVNFMCMNVIHLNSLPDHH